NGSPNAVAGLTTEDGRVTILMPHPERTPRTVNFSWAPRDWPEDSPWLRMFRNARAAIGCLFCRTFPARASVRRGEGASWRAREAGVWPAACGTSLCRHAAGASMPPAVHTPASRDAPGVVGPRLLPRDHSLLPAG